MWNFAPLPMHIDSLFTINKQHFPISIEMNKWKHLKGNENCVRLVRCECWYCLCWSYFILNFIILHLDPMPQTGECRTLKMTSLDLRRTVLYCGRVIRYCLNRLKVLRRCVLQQQFPWFFLKMFTQVIWYLTHQKVSNVLECVFFSHAHLWWVW